MSDILIVGIGNPFRGDDGAGWAVIDALEKKIKSGVMLRKIHGDIVELMDIFEHYSSVYLVDACCMDAPPGFWQRINAHRHTLPLDNPQTSTHGLSLSQAIALAKTLDQVPSKLSIYAITGDQYNIGTTLSPPVAGIIEMIAQNIFNEEDIQSCMKKE